MLHILLTRFNLRASQHDAPPREEWLVGRARLFAQFTAPSVREQGHRKFGWSIFCDAKSPTWLLEFLGECTPDAQIVLLPFFSPALIAESVADRLAPRTRLITTRLDNDDALGRDFMATVYREAGLCKHSTAINVINGCQLSGDRVCLRSDPSNAFISLVEDVTVGGPRTVFDMQHQQWIATGAVRQAVTAPMWMQVIHGRNAMNRLSGIPIKPSVVQAQFPFPLPPDLSRARLAGLRVTSILRLCGRIASSPHRMIWLWRVGTARLRNASARHV